MRVLRAVPLGAVAFLVACSAMTSFDNFSARENTMSEDASASSTSSSAGGSTSSSSSSSSSGGSTTSSGATPDAAGFEGGTPISLVNDGFESTTTTCSGWTVDKGIATIETEGHTGSKSCRLCASIAGESPKLRRDFPQPGPGLWKIEAWAKSVTTDAGTPGEWKVRISSIEDDGDLSSSWSMRSASVLVAIVGLEKLEARIELGSSTVGRCMLIDDIVVTHTPPK